MKKIYKVATLALCAFFLIPFVANAQNATIRGTMFPFVQLGISEFDNLFPVIVKLTSVPPQCTANPIEAALSLPVLHSTQAIYYNGTIPVATTPKNPGTIGSFDNPGEKLRWTEKLNKPSSQDPDYPKVTGSEVPSSPVGLFIFENVAPGDYLLHITRKGFITRFVRVTVTSTGWQERHWELVAGDVNGDLVVDPVDMSSMKTKIATYGSSSYIPWYDLNGDSRVTVAQDMQFILNNMGADVEIYQDTYNWLEWNFAPSCP